MGLNSFEQAVVDGQIGGGAENRRKLRTLEDRLNQLEETTKAELKELRRKHKLLEAKHERLKKRVRR